MPKEDVDIVTLIATQELTEAVGATKDWWMILGEAAPGSKFSRKSRIETVAAIIAEQLGSAANLPDRVYIIGEDMPAGATIENDEFGNPTILIDPYLNGKDGSLFRRGTEYMHKGPEWQNDVAGGGIRLTAEGDQFETGALYAFIFKPVISGVMSSPDAVARFTAGEQLITADTVAGPLYDRKLIRVQGAAAAAVTYTLNPAYPENVLCVIVTGGGSNKQTIVLPPAGQTLTRGAALARLVLGEVDYAHLVRSGNTWRVVASGERWKYVGRIAYGGIPGPDVIAANGQTLLIADYPGLDDYLTALNMVWPGAVVSVGDWATARTKWGRDATTIKVKDLRGRYIRGLDLGAGIDPRRSGANASKGVIPGDYALGQLLAHTHGYKKGKLFRNSDSSGNPDYVAEEDAQTESTGGVENSVNDSGEPVLICI